jgi:uncharacterized small protein (DUF1192 family)
MLNHIRKLELTRLHNEEHFGFHSEVSKLISESNLSETFSKLVSNYNEYYDEYDVAMEIARKSEFTDDLLIADRRRLRTFRSFRSAVEGFFYHFDETKQRAGKRLDNIIRVYGRLARLNRDKRTYALMNLLQDMRDKGAADVQLLGLSTWIAELEANNLAYQQLKESRYTEKTELPEQRVMLARKAADAGYKEITKYLDVMSGLSTGADDNLKTLVAELNERIAAYDYLVARRKGTAAARKAASTSESSSSSSSSLAVA